MIWVAKQQLSISAAICYAIKIRRNESGSFQFVMLVPTRITLRASKLREAVLHLPKVLGLEWKYTNSACAP